MTDSSYSGTGATYGGTGATYRYIDKSISVDQALMRAGERGRALRTELARLRVIALNRDLVALASELEFDISQLSSSCGWLEDKQTGDLEKAEARVAASNAEIGDLRSKNLVLREACAQIYELAERHQTRYATWPQWGAIAGAAIGHTPSYEAPAK